MSPPPTSPRLGEFLHRLGPTLCQTQALGTAVHMLGKSGTDYVVITDMSERPIGLVTETDIEDLEYLPNRPKSSRRCSSAVKTTTPILSVDDAISDVVEIFRHDEVRPLLVSEAGDVVGVLPPTEVFQWCAEHQPAALDHIASGMSTAGRVENETPTERFVE